MLLTTIPDTVAALYVHFAKPWLCSQVGLEDVSVSVSMPMKLS